jgi:glycosyltransferase involved in cell wall biosynthesis
VFYQYYCTPRGAWGTRYYEFSRRWVAAGHQVTIVSAIYDKSDLEPTGFVTRRTIEGAHIIAMNLRLSNKHGMVHRIWTFILFSLLSSWYALTLPADIVVASSGPISIGVPGLIARWLRGKPLIFEVRDLWPEGAIQMGLLRSPWAQAVARWFERLCYRSSKVVVALSPGMAEGVSRVAPKTPVVVIPNSADLEMFDPARPATPAPEMNGGFVVLYAGTLGRANSSTEIVDLATELKARGQGDVRIVVLGDGYERASMERLSRERGLDNLVFLGLRAKGEVAAWHSRAALTLCAFKPYPVLATCSPNKLFDSLAAGRPVINNTDGWIRDLLARHDCGLTFPVGNVAQAADHIMALYQDPARRDAMGRRARQAAETEFSLDRAAARFAELFPS